MSASTKLVGKLEGIDNFHFWKYRIGLILVENDLVMQMATRHVRCHQDLLFPWPEELSRSSNPLSGLFRTHMILPRRSLIVLSGNRTHTIANPDSTGSGLANPRILMVTRPRLSLLLIGNFPRREIGTCEVTNHSPRESPILDL
jgi:hypothetical protein